MTLNRKLELIALGLLFCGIGALAANVIADESLVTITAKIPVEKANVCREEGCYVMTKEELMDLLSSGCSTGHAPVSFLRRKAPLL